MTLCCGHSLLRYRTGKEATELSVTTDSLYVRSDLTVTKSENQQCVITAAKKNKNSNLLIRTIAHNIITKTLVLPAHEVLDRQLEINRTKKLNLTKKESFLSESRYVHGFICVLQYDSRS